MAVCKLLSAIVCLVLVPELWSFYPIAYGTSVSDSPVKVEAKSTRLEELNVAIDMVKYILDQQNSEKEKLLNERANIQQTIEEELTNVKSVGNYLREGLDDKFEQVLTLQDTLAKLSDEEETLSKELAEAEETNQGMRRQFGIILSPHIEVGLLKGQDVVCSGNVDATEHQVVDIAPRSFSTRKHLQESETTIAEVTLARLTTALKTRQEEIDILNIEIENFKRITENIQRKQEDTIANNLDNIENIVEAYRVLETKIKFSKNNVGDLSTRLVNTLRDVDKNKNTLAKIVELIGYFEFSQNMFCLKDKKNTEVVKRIINELQTEGVINNLVGDKDGSL